MKILFVWRKSDVGGVETWMLGLARCYRRLGHDCELFFFQRGPFAEQMPAEIPVHFGNLEDLLRVVSARRFDVVHGATSDWDLGITGVRSLGAKLVVTHQSVGDPGWNSSNCDAIVGCSQWGSDEQQQTSDMPVHTVLNGVDIDRFRPPTALTAGPPIVAWVGRGADLRQKRINLLAQIAPHLRAGGCRLWVADPDGRGRVAPEVAETLSATAEHWGPVPFARMPDFYREIAASGGCILSTSSFEGVSLAYLEAQASGCPVIGADVPGVNEGIDGARGGVIYPDDTPPEQIAALILATVGDPERMEGRRRASREFIVQRFSLEATAREYLRIYAVKHRPWFRGYLKRLVGFPTPAQLRRFVASNWSAAISQYQASSRLAERGESRLASRACVASFLTCPTIYLRRRRLAHLLSRLCAVV